jgi:cobalt-zinc-cadmium efflux system membrane fusion protein
MPKRIVLLILAVLIMSLGGWLAWDQIAGHKSPGVGQPNEHGPVSAAPPTATPSAALRSDTAADSQASPAEIAQTVKFAVGSAQLEMIQTQAIPSSPMPLTDTLSARVVYDEDLTARIGVGISGRVVAIRVAPGDPVKVGQVLAEVDSPDFGTAFADLHKAKAEEERRRQTVERARELGAGEAIAAREVETAQADFKQAQAETVRAEQRIKTLNPYGHPVSGQRVRLSSPINGVVAERTATPALEVTPGMTAPLFTITDPKHLWLLIDLPEKLIGQVKLDGEVAVESDAFPNERFKAKIVQLGQAVDPNTRRVVMRARINNPDRKLLPEMFVRASLLQGFGTAVRIPNDALINRGLYAFVFVESTPGEFTRRPVKLHAQGSDFSYVSDGLSGGERVVVSGALLLDAELTARASSKP